MLFKRINEDYQAWLSLGPGGGPHNPFGYMLSYLLGLLGSRDLKSTACYESEPPANRYLEDVPARVGAGPVISKWFYPVRQLDSGMDKMRIQQIGQTLDGLVKTNEQFFTAPSLLEGGYSKALFLKGKATEKDSDKPARKREIFHCHDTEGSTHATLSPSDAATLLDQGWGERHPISGKLGIPLTYIMIYAPRSNAEMDVLTQVAQAAMGFALERRQKGTV